MAEKINKPPKFTKAWFSYIWYYYKIHILVGVAVILLGIYTVYDISSIVDYDIKLAAITKDTYMSEEVQEKLSTVLEDVTGDINENGNADGLVTYLSFSDEIMNNAEMLVALDSKLMTMLISEDEMLYVCDEAMVKKLLNMGATDGAYLPVSEWGGEKSSEELGYEYKDGTYAASLKNSQILKNAGIDSEDLYIMVKVNVKADDEENAKRFEASCKFAKKIIK